jgi:hypothetical protein
MTPQALSFCLALVAALVLLTGCGGEECGEDCTLGVRCSEVIDVPSDADLEDAAAAASAGSCIALAPGSYGEVTLPGGASLLGPGADAVTVGSVTVRAGGGAVVRRVHVGGVVRLEPNATDVRLAELRVTGSKNGVQAAAGVSVTLSDSLVTGVPEIGVVAVDAARLTVERTRVVGSGRSGFWAQCASGCEVALSGIELEGNAYYGAVLVGAQAALRSVAIRGTRIVLEDENSGVGLVASAGATVEARDLSIESSGAFGFLVANASAKLGGTGDEKGIIIINNKKGGGWVTGTGAGQIVHLENVTMTGNAGVGLGVGASAKGIIIINNRIEKTSLASVEAEGWVDDGGMLIKTPIGQASVGDGLLWSAGADLAVEGLTLSENGRQPLLIDGAVGGGSIKGLVLEKGDEKKGVVQQAAPAGAASPSVESGVAIDKQEQAPHATAVAPKAPEAL